MPVVFRCTACRKKLSVARRKAGSEIACPVCSSSILVPSGQELRGDLEALLNSASTSVGTGTANRTATKPLAAVAPNLDEGPLFERTDIDERPLFERNDFDELLSAETAAPAVESPPVPLIAKPTASSDVVLTRGAISMLATAVAFLLGLAFAIGYLVGSR